MRLINRIRSVAEEMTEKIELTQVLQAFIHRECLLAVQGILGSLWSCNPRRQFGLVIRANSGVHRHLVKSGDVLLVVHLNLF